MTENAQFWDEFSKIHTQLENEETSPNAMEHLLSSLEQIDKRLYFHLGSLDNRMDLILSAEGHAQLMPVLNQLKKDAPAVQNWSVQVAYEGMLLFGERNDQVFPATENGDVLFNMAQSGDSLWIARKINFSLIFPDRESAQGFSAKATSENFQCKVDKYDVAEGYKFQVEVSIEMVPNHEAITSIESHMEELAQPYGGRNDGWGCFEVQS